MPHAKVLGLLGKCPSRLQNIHCHMGNVSLIEATILTKLDGSLPNSFIKRFTNYLTNRRVKIDLVRIALHGLLWKGQRSTTAKNSPSKKREWSAL